MEQVTCDDQYLQEHIRVQFQYTLDSLSVCDKLGMLM